MKAARILQASTLTILLSAGIFVGCSSRSDSQIASDVQSKINGDNNVQSKQIGINSDKGVVTLTGSVNSDMERSAAANDAAQVQGVKTVVNDLQVNNAANQPDMNNESMNSQVAPQRPSRSSHRNKPAPSNEYANDTVTQSASNTGTGIGASNPSSMANNAVASAPPAPVTVTIPEGTPISVTLIDSLSSETNHVGDTFRASLVAPLVDENDRVAVPANSDVQGHIVAVQPSTHFSGHSALTVQLDKVTAGGKTYDISTNQWSKQGAGRGKRSAETIGGGAGVGALIGAIVGGGKGAAIGAGAGAAAGTGVQGVTHGEAVRLASETRLDFRLQSPVTVTPASSAKRQVVQ